MGDWRKHPTLSPRGAQLNDTDSESVITEVAENEPVTPAVEFRGVHFSFDDQKILNDISFKVAKGEIKIILSGIGRRKTTILKLSLDSQPAGRDP